MNKLLIFIICCLLLTQSVSAAEDAIFTFIPTVVKKRPDFHSSVRKPFVNGYKHIIIHLEIDKSGKVKSVKPLEKSDSLYTSFVTDYLKSVEFYPALKDGEATKTILPVLVHLSGKISSPDIEYPLTEENSNFKLLRLSYELNNILLPKIISFPSYSADLKPTDSALYKYQLYKLVIEASGKLSSIEKIRSTNHNFDGQIESAMLYATFEPSKQKNKGKRSSCFLKISYFPTLHYPTVPFSAVSDDSLSQLKNRRLEILPITAKLLSEPLPKTIPDHLFPISNIQYAIQRAVEVFVHIDTLGKVTPMRTDATIRTEKGSVRKICKKLRLYPAIDINGDPVDFYGYIRFSRFEQTNIRVSYLWLE